MASSIPQLLSLLDSKRNELQELLSLTEQEQRCIIEIDIPGLESLDNRKRELLQTMEKTNADCRKLLQEASHECQLVKVDGLTPIISRVAPPMQDKLKGVQTGLVELGDALNRAMEFNGELLVNSVRHIQDSLGFLSSFFTTSTTYGEAGSMVRNADEVRLVCKEA